MAIVFILGIVPFAVAFITNAGSSTDGSWENSLNTANAPQSTTGSYWVDNGGANFTSDYVNNSALIVGTIYESCAYVVDGVCRGNNLNLTFPVYFPNMPLTDTRLPMTSTAIYGSHYYADPSGAFYTGSSGPGPFGWVFNSAYLNDVDNGTTMDKLRFTFVNEEVTYSCSSSVFTNISFDGFIEFSYGGNQLRFDDFEFQTSNLFRYQAYDDHHNTWSEVCQVGFQVEFDFTGFESLKLYEFNQGHWDGTWMYLNFDNFVNEERPNSFANTALPFACNCVVGLGIEHQDVDPVQAGFIIKTGTLILSLGTFALAIASTPYWDPFKNTFKGMIE